MPKLIVLYPSPVDAATFERRYSAEHVPMVFGKVPGLKKFVAARLTPWRFRLAVHRSC